MGNNLGSEQGLPSMERISGRPGSGHLFVLLSLFVALSCSERPALRIVLVGIDGADWSVIDPLIADGSLPTFRSIREHGRSGPLLTLYSNVSPAIWTSIATGKHPQDHGITNFLVHTKDSYYEIPATSDHRRAAAIWNILSHYNRRVSVIGWWASWPAERVNGNVVSQRFFLSSFGVGPIGGKRGIGVGGENPRYRERARLLTWPDELAPLLESRLSREVLRRAASTELGGLLAEIRRNDPPPGLTHDLEVVENILQTDLLVAETAASLEGDSPYDLTALYFEGVDVVSHLFWKYYDAEAGRGVHEAHTDQSLDEGRYARIIPLYYREIDRLLGRLLARAGPDVMVAIVSDHGFSAYENPFDYNYPANGLLERLELLRLTPDGKVDFSHSDWFDYASNPWDPIRRIYLNLEGRFPEGTVKREQARAKLDELSRTLRQLKTASGETVILQVIPLNDGSGARIRINPRLRRDDRIVFGELHVSVSSIFPPRRLSGNHRPQGILALYGGGLSRGSIPAQSSLNVAPTLLALLGLPVAEDMAGHPIDSIVTARGAEVSSVRSYDFLLEARTRELRDGSTADDALKTRLRALGYIQ